MTTPIYDEIVKRLNSLNQIDLDERLSYLEKHMSHLIRICTEIHKSYTPVYDAVKIINRECVNIQSFRQNFESQIKKEFDDVSISGSLKFMAKKLNELSDEVKSIKENGLKKSIQLDVTMDGYEMIKKTPKENYDFKEKEPEPEDAIKELLKTLADREQEVLIHKYGLFGEKAKTHSQIGKIFKLSGGRIGDIYRKSIRKCCHPTRLKIVKKITHFELKKDIMERLSFFERVENDV